VGYHVFPTVVPGGFVGVDIFFVISGFLISSIIFRAIGDGRFSFIDFYARRVRRIFPALGVVLIFCGIAGWFLLWGSEFSHLSKHIVAAVGFVSNVALWRESGYFDAAAETKPLLHLWSLGIEEQFYLIWPLLLWGAAKFRRSVPALLMSLTLASFALSIVLVNRDSTAAFFLPFPRFWELMVGSGFAYASGRGWVSSGTKWIEVRAAAGIAAICVALTLLNPRSAFPGWWALLPTLGTVLLISAGPGAWFNRHILSRRALVAIGLISYPLYLWHWPLLTFSRMEAAQPLSIPVRAAIVIVSFICAWATYQAIERPIRRQRLRRVAPVLCACLAGIGAVALFAAVSPRIPRRYPDALANIDRFSLMSADISREWRRYRCMLESEGSFADECVDPTPADAPIVVLWGDSHSAALFPGLRDQQRLRRFRVAQFSTSRCPPIVGYVGSDPRLDNPQCNRLNTAVLARIRELRASLVILTAYWELYKPERLRETIADLQSAGVPRIVVAGNVPIWIGNPSRVVFQLYRRSAMREIPERAPIDNFRMPRSSDSTVSFIAQASNAGFVSLLDALCDATTCLTSVDHEFVWTDGDHLAPAGARFIAGKVFGLLLQQLDLHRAEQP
jgi:peptidoglycan/LPS O-acetylase OafA/YrhL